MSQIFRQAAVDQLSSPDELDILSRVTTGKTWIALAGVGAGLVLFIAWTLAGRLPVRLQAQECILFDGTGVSMVSSPAAGRVTHVLVQPGDIVRKGDPVVELEHTEYDQKVEGSERRLEELRRQFDVNTRLGTESDALMADASDEKRRVLDLQVRNATAKVAALENRAAAQHRLFADGMVTRATVDSADFDLAGARIEVEDSTSQLRQIDVNLGERRKQRAVELAALKNQIQDLQDSIVALKLEQHNASQVLSPAGGRVIELRATVGQYLERGAAVANLEQAHTASDMRAYIYLPVTEGRKILPGMAVEVNPTTSMREEYGFLRASVSSVADQPSTSQGLMLLYSNERLVQQLTTAYAPLQVVASLRRADRPNPTGFQWSTRSGPPDALRNGTACSASVVLREVHPIELMFPELKRYLGAPTATELASNVRSAHD